MKVVTNKLMSYTTFADIKTGELFEFNRVHFLKFRKVDGEDYKFNSVCLENGMCASFDNAELVKPIKGHLEVEE